MLYRYEGKTDSFVPSRDPATLSRAATAAVFHPEIGLVVGYEDGSCEILTPGFISPKTACSEHSEPIVAFSLAGNRVVGVTLSGFTFALNSSELKPISMEQFSCDLPRGRYSSLLAINSKTILVGSLGKGLFICAQANTGSVQNKSARALLPMAASVHEITKSPFSDDIFIATDAGLIKTGVSDTEPATLADHSLYGTAGETTGVALAQDRSVWISSFAGVHQLQLSSLRIVKQLPQTEHTALIGATTLGKRRVILADYTNVFTMDREAFFVDGVEKIVNVRPVSGGISSITTLGSNLLVGLRSGGLLQLTQSEVANNKDVRPRYEDALGPITFMTRESQDSVLIGTFGNGAFRYDGRKVRQIDYVSQGGEPAKLRVLFIHPLRTGGLLIGTEWGLITHAISKKSRYLASLILRTLDGRVAWAAAENNEVLWLATPRGGIFGIRKSKSSGKTPRTIHQGLGEAVVQSLETTRDGRTFAATTSGIYRIDQPETIRPLFAGSSSSSIRFDFGVSWQTKSNHFFFGGTGGFVVFNADTLLERSPGRLAKFTRYSIDETTHRFPMATGERYQLHVPGDHKKVLIGFGSIYRDISGSGAFRYKLEGFDTTWVNAGTSNEATYTNLPAGDYVFEVQASNVDGTWNPESARLPVSVAVHWSMTLWAFAAYAALLLLLFWLAKRYYANVVVRRQALDMAEEMTSTATLAMEDLQEEVATHAALIDNVKRLSVANFEWLGELVARQAEAVGDPGAAELALTNQTRIRAFACLEKVLTYQGENILANMRAFTDECAAMLCTEHPEKAQVIIINEIPERLLDAELAFALAAVIHELLQNALLYAFPASTPGSYISLGMAVDNDDSATSCTLELRVDDNGCGLPGAEWKTFAGAGLQLVDEIAARYDGELRAENHGGASLRVVLRVAPEAFY